MDFQRFGLIGYPLGHSLSKPLHTFFLKKMQQEGSYENFSILPENLLDEMEKLYNSKLIGINVTIPHKQAVISFLDEVSPQAKKIGAINTIHFKDGKKIGYNTDYHGFGMILERMGFNPANKKAIILGAGGSALAVANYLEDKKATKVIIFSRNEKMASHGNFPVLSYKDLSKNIVDADILINCTPVGMYPNIDEMPVDMSLLDSFSGVVVDMIYNPTQTKLMKAAKSRSLQASGGLLMLVGQGFVAQEIWQDKVLDTTWLDEAEELLKNILETSS